ncbi:MAG: ABC transporter permease [Tuberibacillus sp.]
MLQNLLEQTVNLTIIAILLRVTTPILLAALGGLISDLAGIVNIGLEGLMLISAFTSIAVCSATGSWVIGVVAGVAATMLISYLMGVVSLKLDVDIIITGFAVNIFGSGVTVFLMGMIYGVTGNFSPTHLNGIPNIVIPGVKDIPYLGTLLSGHNLMVWIALIAVVFVFYLLYRTPYGSNLRAVGEAPEAAKSLGIRVNRVKYSALLWSGVFAGLAGAYLSMGMTSMFVKDMTAGTGFLALAVVMFGNRNPIGILIGSLIFGLASTITTLVETTSNNHVPSQFLKMIPYIVTIIALVVYALRRRKKPVIKGDAEEGVLAE